MATVFFVWRGGGTKIFKCGGGSWYSNLSWGGRLCLSACPGDGQVKKNCRPPEDNFWNSPYSTRPVSTHSDSAQEKTNPKTEMTQ